MSVKGFSECKNFVYIQNLEAKIGDVVLIGDEKTLGEVILAKDQVTVQIFDFEHKISLNDKVTNTNKPLMII